MFVALWLDQPHRRTYIIAAVISTYYASKGAADAGGAGAGGGYVADNSLETQTKVSNPMFGSGGDGE